MKVGCGCQLINGLCSACNNKLKNATKRIKDVMKMFAKSIRNEWFEVDLMMAKSRLEEQLDAFSNGEYAH